MRRRRVPVQSPAARAVRALRIICNADAHTAAPPARWWHGCKMAWFECPTCEEHYSAAGGAR